MRITRSCFLWHGSFYKTGRGARAQCLHARASSAPGVRRDRVGVRDLPASRVSPRPAPCPSPFPWSPWTGSGTATFSRHWIPVREIIHFVESNDGKKVVDLFLCYLTSGRSFSATASPRLTRSSTMVRHQPAELVTFKAKLQELTRAIGCPWSQEFIEGRPHAASLRARVLGARTSHMSCRTANKLMKAGKEAVVRVLEKTGNSHM